MIDYRPKNMVWFYMLDDSTGHVTKWVWPTAVETRWHELKRRDYPMLLHADSINMARWRVTCLSAVHTNNTWTFATQRWGHEIQTGVCVIYGNRVKKQHRATHVANSVTYRWLQLVVLNNVMWFEIIHI